MKKIILILLSLMSINAFAQKAVYCDPAVSDLTFTSMQNASTDAGMLILNTPVKVNCIVANADGIKAIPAGTCKLKITLGSKFALLTDVHGTGLPLSEYFKWDMQVGSSGRQAIIIGDLIQDLPAGFSQKVSFNVRPSIEGESTVTTQFLITNHGTSNRTLSDKESSNNAVSASYKIYKQFKVGFANETAKPHACNVMVNWDVADENTLARFLIQTSEDGINYTTVLTILPNGSLSYKALLENLSKNKIMLRIKAEAETGQVVYSKVLPVENICNNRFEITLYPNPVSSDVTSVNIYAKGGIFNGKYNIRLIDAAGKEMLRTYESFTNQTTVKFNTGFIASGTYYIEMRADDGQLSKVKFVKQ